MTHTIKHCDRFDLVQLEEGFVWTMPGPEGDPWYWHPDKAQWTALPCARPSPEQASVGLNPDAPQAPTEFHHNGPRVRPEPGAGEVLSEHHLPEADRPGK
jgi:hypothetical protein